MKNRAEQYVQCVTAIPEKKIELRENKLLKRGHVLEQSLRKGASKEGREWDWKPVFWGRRKGGGDVWGGDVHLYLSTASYF